MNMQFERAKAFTLGHLEDLSAEIICKQVNNPNTYILFNRLNNHSFEIEYKAIKSQYFIDSVVTQALELYIIELSELSNDLIQNHYPLAFDFIIRRSYQRMLDLEYADRLEMNYPLEKL